MVRRFRAWLFTIRLFIVFDQHSRRKYAVADAITLAGPCHPIIDDVGAGCPGWTDLADFDPPLFAEYGQSPLEGRERSEEHTSELQSLMRISYAVFCLKKKKQTNHRKNTNIEHYITLILFTIHIHINS